MARGQACRRQTKTNASVETAGEAAGKAAAQPGEAAREAAAT